jgi:hypothetical protein
MIADGPTRYLKDLMLHIRDETMTDFISKHIRYADMESDEWLRDLVRRRRGVRAERFEGAMRLRQYLRREVWPRVPLKPLIRFVYMYFVRLGILDGRAGWQLAVLMSNYEYMIELLFKEKRQQYAMGIVPPGLMGRIEAPATVPSPEPATGS